MQKILFILLFFCSFCPVFGQKYILLDRYSTERIRFQIGETITFRIKNDRYKRTDVIIGLQDSMVFLAKYGELTLKEFDLFYVVRAKGFFKWVKTGFNSGAILFGAFTLSNLNDKELAKKNLLISASSLGLAQVCRFLHVRRYFITPQTRIRIMNMDFQETK